MYNNQQLLPFVIISTIPLTIMHDSGSVMRGEIRCQSLLWVKHISDQEYCNSLPSHTFPEILTGECE